MFQDFSCWKAWCCRFTYERKAIEKWMRDHTHSPVEPETLLDRNKELIPNLTMAAHIRMFYGKAGIPL